MIVTINLNLNKDCQHRCAVRVERDEESIVFQLDSPDRVIRLDGAELFKTLKMFGFSDYWLPALQIRAE